jgi:hypothetical protein
MKHMTALDRTDVTIVHCDYGSIVVGPHHRHLWESVGVSDWTPGMHGDTDFKEAWLRGPAGTEFYTRTYVPSSAAKAVLVFVHGFIGL